MRRIWSFFLWSWTAIWGLILCAIGIVLFIPLNPWVDPRRRLWDYAGKMWGKGVLFALPFVDVTVSGTENIGKGPYLICPNHTSYADTVVCLATLPLFKFIGRGMIFNVPPLSFQAHLAGYVRAGAGGPGDVERVMRETKRWFSLGSNVLVFPEGTRSPDGRIMRFRKGPIMLAQLAGVKILPVAVSGNHYIQPKGSFSYRFHGKVHVEVLPPIEAVGELKDIARKTRDVIQAALKPELLWQEDGPNPLARPAEPVSPEPIGSGS